MHWDKIRSSWESKEKNSKWQQGYCRHPTRRRFWRASVDCLLEAALVWLQREARGEPGCKDRGCLTKINSAYSEQLEGAKQKNNRAIFWMEPCQIWLHCCAAWKPTTMHWRESDVQTPTQQQVTLVICRFSLWPQVRSPTRMFDCASKECFCSETIPCATIYSFQCFLQLHAIKFM